MNEKQDKKDLMFHQRHPWLPLIASIISLVASTIVLAVETCLLMK